MRGRLADPPHSPLATHWHPLPCLVPASWSSGFKFLSHLTFHLHLNLFSFLIKPNIFLFFLWSFILSFLLSHQTQLISSVYFLLSSIFVIFLSYQTSWKPSDQFQELELSFPPPLLRFAAVVAATAGLTLSLLAGPLYRSTATGTWRYVLKRCPQGDLKGWVRGKGDVFLTTASVWHKPPPLPPPL